MANCSAMSNYELPKALKTYNDGEAARARKKQPFNPDKPRYAGLPKRRASDNRRAQQSLHIYHLRKAATDQEILADLRQFSGLSDADEDAIYFRRLKDPQFAVVCFPDVESARKAKMRMEHGEFAWILRKKKEHEEGCFASKAATGFKADFITKKKALELERMDDEARAGGDVQGNAARSTTPPQSSGKVQLCTEPAVHFKVDAIRQALNLPNLGNDAARSMTVASQLFMEELLQRAAYEAERDGSATITPEHLKRVAPYVFLQF